MLKRMIFFLIIALSLSYVLAQEGSPQNELRVRYLSTAGTITINLTRFLGSSEGYNYAYSAPVYIDITIDQTTGITQIKGIPGWFGSEVIVFKVNKTEEEVFLEENETAKIKLKISDSEIASLFNYNLAQDSFSILSGSIGQEIVKSVQARIDKDRLNVLVNKDIEISASASKTPEISINILTGNLSNVKISSAIEKTEGYLAGFISFTLYLGGIVVLLFLLKYLFSKGLIRKKGFISSPKSIIVEKLNKIEHSKDPEASNALMYVINEFFMRYFYVSLGSNSVSLNGELERRGIMGNLKQDILAFFERYKFGIPQKDTGRAIHDLKSLLRRLN